jgi:hypothetical protein
VFVVVCAELSGFCDCCGKWVWPSGEPDVWEETWEPTPVSSSRGLRILGPMRALVSSSGSILVSLPLYFFKTRELHYLCISFITPEFM